MPEKPFADVTLEKVQRSDLDQLEKLFASAFSDEVDIEQVRRKIRRARQFYYILQPLSQFSVWVKNHFNVYVAKIAEKVIGFIQVSYLNPTQIHIDYIAFGRQYRGKGLGRWVLSKLLTEIADVNQYDVVLEVRVNNRAYHLYRQLGFTVVTEILHYELNLDLLEQSKLWLDSEFLAGFRNLQDADRAKLYRLYLEAVPTAFRQVIKRAYGEFNPSMIVRHLDWAKNYLMRKETRDYVVEQNGQIFVWLTITSYLRIKSHVITLLIHPDYEGGRRAVIGKAVNLIAARFRQGIINTTIYGDKFAKQAVLEQLGFSKESAYLLMFRPAEAGRQYTGRLPADKLQPLPGRKLIKRKP